MNGLNDTQLQALEHLKRWKVGALFMEPGTGKTRVAVSIANSIDDLDLVLWVAPLRTIIPSPYSVVNEIEKSGGFKAPVRYCGVESIGQSDRVYLETLNAVETAQKCMIIVDESLKIKNVNAHRTKRMIALSAKSEYRLILNGTPITRNVGDLWAQMQFLSPLILNMSHTEYVNTFCTLTRITERKGSYERKKEWITGYANIDYLYSLIRPYVFEAVLSLQVAENYHNVPFYLNEGEMDEYKSIKAKFLSLSQEFGRVPLMEMLQALQHSYCTAADKCFELNRLFLDIPQDKTIIFCKYVDSAVFCRENFPKALVLTYGKNAYGLNLQEYNHTIYWDKTWDLAERLQADRRTYRTGQLNDVHYYDLTGNVGLERMIDRNIENKTGMLEFFKKVSKEQIIKEL